MDITGPESFHTTMILTLDLHAPVPAWIVNLATKKARARRVLCCVYCSGSSADCDCVGHECAHTRQTYT